ncbi:diphthine synthase [Methanobacterium spitsbergense]|uniref:Diphthine synthase n=1 Tax=Methanobacterium spitsbergense TaxID=2874285 RepID=A0A8T5UV81_9EURY|nr:diphthine synthase [Methanobacterium spitsbergense]MBZ2166137.1 diphthine synthase [Methanobacterium spitsbergense]
MFYFIGLGLYDEKDISVKGVEALKKVEAVYAEFYTAKLFGGSISSLEEIIGNEIKILTREEVEEENLPLKEAKIKDVAFLSAGDPLIATTHSEMLIEAKKAGIKTTVIHSSSILSAAPGIAGLQAYKFGKVTTIPFTEENYFPHSPYLAIKANMDSKLHTLVLLDIMAHENRYMTANQGMEYLLLAETDKKLKIATEETVVVVVARAGSGNPLVRADRIKNLINSDFGGPLHCLMIPGDLHFMEAEALVELADAPKELFEDLI